MDNTQHFIPLNDHIAQLGTEPGSYVICGRNRALVIDTGYGTENHRAWAAEYTSLPLTLACTHVHPDHVGGNIYYAEALLHPAEFDRYQDMFRPEQMPEPLRGLRPAVPKEMNDGEIIDLGGRQVEVIHTQGHTPGSCCLLDVQGRVLVTGDSVLRNTTWLLFPYSLTVEEHNASLRKLSAMRGRFDSLLTGHTRGMQPVSLLDDLLEASNAILAGKTDRAGLYADPYDPNGEPLPCYYYGDYQGSLVYRRGFIHKTDKAQNNIKEGN